MSFSTVKVSNLSLGASERDITEFFSFSGDIKFVEMKSDTELSQIAFVTFKDSQGAETAVLLTRIDKISKQMTFKAIIMGLGISYDARFQTKKME